jgi:hypothetical protein
MVKTIIETLILLVTQPAKAWKLIADRKETHEEFLSHFIYPLIGVCALSAFVGELFGSGESNVQNALKEATGVLTSLFAGYYAASFAVKQISMRWFPMEGDIRFFQRYIGYAMAITFVITAILELMPDFFFIRIGELYVFYIVWESVGTFVQVEEKKRVRFATAVSAFILLSPYVIEKVLFALMPGMKNN